VLASTPTAVVGKVAIKRVNPDELAEPPVMMGTAIVDDGAELPLVAPAPARPPAPAAAPAFGLAMVADDVALHRTLIADGLKGSGLCGQVVCTARGDAFVTAATEHLLRLQPPDLYILDLEMPGLSGFHAAIALRAVERAMGRPPTPVLFFSARLCDAPFRKAMEEVGNAGYLNKAGASPEQLLSRLTQVLQTFAARARA